MDENFFGDDSNQPPMTGNLDQPNPANQEEDEFDFSGNQSYTIQLPSKRHLQWKLNTHYTLKSLKDQINMAVITTSTMQMQLIIKLPKKLDKSKKEFNKI